MAGSVFFGGFGQASVASGCPPSWTPSAVVPGLCWAGPATTPAIVKAAVDGALPEIRAPFVAFARKPRTPAEADAFLVAWANGAFNAWKAASDLAATVRSEFSPLLGRMALLYVDRFDAAVLDWRKRWDVRFPSLQAVRSHLMSLPPDQAVPPPVMLEVIRLAVHHAGFAGEIRRVSNTEYVTQIRQIYAARADAVALTNSLELGLETISSAIGSAVREAVRLAAKNVLAPLFGALLPRWAWFALAGVGGLILYGVVSGHPAVGGARALYGKARERLRAG